MSSPLRRSSRISSPSCNNNNNNNNKENSLLLSPSKKLSSSSSSYNPNIETPPEQQPTETTPTKKRRRQKVNQTTPVDNLLQPSPDPLPHTADQDASDAKRERDARKKARRSLGRRVSFAATARVRLFNKDATPEISPEAARKSRYFALSEMQDSSLSLLGSENEAPASSHGLSMFQIPDLSSVVTGGDNTFDLRLSLDGCTSSDQTTDQRCIESREDDSGPFSQEEMREQNNQPALSNSGSDNQNNSQPMEEERPALDGLPPALSRIIGAENVTVRRDSFGSDADFNGCAMQVGGGVGAENESQQKEAFEMFTEPPSFDDAMDVTECIGGINTEPYLENTDNILPHQSTRLVSDLDVPRHRVEDEAVDDRTADRFQISPISNRRISIASSSSPSYRPESRFAENSTAMDLTRCLGGIIDERDDTEEEFDDEVHGWPSDRETADPTMDITRCIGGIREARQGIASPAVEEERKVATTVADENMYADHVEYNIHLNDGYHPVDDEDGSFGADEDDDMDLTRCIGVGFRQGNERSPNRALDEVEPRVASRNRSLTPEQRVERTATRNAVSVEDAFSERDAKITTHTPQPRRNTPALSAKGSPAPTLTDLHPPTSQASSKSAAQDKENAAVTRDSVQRDRGPAPPPTPRTSEEPTKDNVPHYSARRPRGGYVSSPLRTVTTMLSPGKLVTNVARSRHAVIVNRRRSVSAASVAAQTSRISASTRRSSFAGDLGHPTSCEADLGEGQVDFEAMVPNEKSNPRTMKSTPPIRAPSPTARRLSFTSAPPTVEATAETSNRSLGIAGELPEAVPHSAGQDDRTPMRDVTLPYVTPESNVSKEVIIQNLKNENAGETTSAVEPVINSRPLSPVPDPIRKSKEDDDAKDRAPADPMGELDEPCIFGEHMDILDDSFIAEIPEPDPITLATFFEMTGIRFMDELTSTKRRETLSKQENVGSPTFADCVKTTAISYPELERNEFCCVELDKYIAEGKRSVAKMEEAINRENPRIFFDLVRTGPGSEERERMLANLRLMKSRARLEARSNWYRWREQLLGSAKCGLKTVLDQLKRDHKYVTRFAEQADSLLPELNQYRKALAARHEEARARQEAIATCDRNQMQSLNEAIREQSVQLDFFSQQLAEAESESTELNEKATALQAQKMLILDAIAEAKTKLEECAGFDEGDLVRLRGEYDRLTKYHLWTPVAASKNALELVYDGRARARIDVSGPSGKEIVLESLEPVEPEKDATDTASRTLKKTTGTFHPLIRNLSVYAPQSEPQQHPPLSRTLRNVSAHCHRLRIIEQEISLLQLRSPVTVVSNPHTLSVTVRFVGLQRPVKFRVVFEIEFERDDAERGGSGFRYPFGELKWTVVKDYGVVDEDTVSDVMSAHEQDGYHRMLAICRDLEVMIQ